MTILGSFVYRTPNNSSEDDASRLQDEAKDPRRCIRLAHHVDVSSFSFVHTPVSANVC